MSPTLGQIVYSKAGRDAGQAFILVGIVDEAYVLISDGDLRRIEKPKKKKVKHLEWKDEIIEALNEKFMKSVKVSNAEIRKALEFYKS